jgi:predicted XRE-type DNA-binding protein
MRNGSSGRSRKTKTTADEPIRFELGSGNVFADLGLPNPELTLAKAELVRRIRRQIEALKLTEASAADRLGISAEKLHALVRGRVERYTYDRLFRFLNALGQQIEIAVRPNPDGAAPRSVIVT